MKNSQKGLQEVFSSIYAEFLARIEKIRCFSIKKVNELFENEKF